MRQDLDLKNTRSSDRLRSLIHSGTSALISFGITLTLGIATAQQYSRENEGSEIATTPRETTRAPQEELNDHTNADHLEEDEQVADTNTPQLSEESSPEEYASTDPKDYEPYVGTTLSYSDQVDEIISQLCYPSSFSDQEEHTLQYACISTKTAEILFFEVSINDSYASELIASMTARDPEAHYAYYEFETGEHLIIQGSREALDVSQDFDSTSDYEPIVDGSLDYSSQADDIISYGCLPSSYSDRQVHTLRYACLSNITGEVLHFDVVSDATIADALVFQMLERNPLSFYILELLPTGESLILTGSEDAIGNYFSEFGFHIYFPRG